jgi:hypothetical protein
MDETFIEPEANVIRSTAGFSIRVLGRTGMRYDEGGRFVRIDSEVLSEPVSVVLFKDSIRFWDGEDPDRISTV